jgi:DNA-binding response OmpR family regulator
MIFNASRGTRAAGDTWSIGAMLYALLRVWPYVGAGAALPAEGTSSPHFRTHRMHLVTDLHMPGLDGASLAKHVRARHPAMRILLMSGYTSELDKAAASLSGAVGTIPKPFTLEGIRAAVKKVLA